MLLIHESSGKLPSMYVTCAAVQVAHEASRRNFCDYCLRFIQAQFRILVGGTGRNVPPSFRSVPGFSNDLQLKKGRLSFHPIPCGTALFGHVTSGATCTACSQVGSGIQAIESLSLAFFKFVSCLYVSLTVDLG